MASVPTMFSSAASSRSLTFKETSSAPKPAVDERQLEQTRLADKSRLLALFEGGKEVTPIDPRLKIKISILRSVIPTIDLIVLDMTDVERDKLLELFNMSFSLTLVTVEDTAQLVGDPQKDIYTVAFACITRTARVLKTLTQVQMLIETDQEILLRESASEIMFLRSIPHLDFENMVWTVYQNPVRHFPEGKYRFNDYELCYFRSRRRKRGMRHGYQLPCSNAYRTRCTINTWPWYLDYFPKSEKTT